MDLPEFYFFDTKKYMKFIVGCFAFQPVTVYPDRNIEGPLIKEKSRTNYARL